MMNISKWVRRFFLMIMIACVSLSVNAGEVGTIVNLVGKANVIRADGTTQSCKPNDKINEGDLVETGKGAFAQLKFIDGGEMILRPDTKIKIDKYVFVKDDPKQDKSDLNLVRGGLRRLTGLIGKRGDKDADVLRTATATAGIRGTIYDTYQCKGDCEGGLADGVYFHVKQGEIVVRNEGGELNVKSGQFAHSQSPSTKMTILPKNPGLPAFNPPKLEQESPSEEGAECAA